MNAIITGGSRGIGLEIIRQLLEKDYTVYYLSRSEINAPLSDKCIHIKCDIGSREETEAALDEVLTRAKTIDLLVNNAGITRDGLVMRMKDEAWDDVIRINLTACFITSRKIGRAMLSARKGSIVNIASVVGLVGNAGQANYAASKAGIIGLTKSLAKEFSARGVRVNAVAPGFIETDMTSVLTEAQKESFVSQIPLKRGGKAEEVAKAVVFLAGDDASYITGQVLAVDGGMTM